MKMYDQLMNDINRHLTVLWQSIAVVITTFALLAVSKESAGDKGLIPLDHAAVLIILICTWAAAHVVDASYWYNRNLVIITNIERQFLRPSDAREIQFYFSTHRPRSKMISHLKLQAWLAFGVVTVVLIFHFVIRVRGACCDLHAPVEWNRSLPYWAALVGFLFVNHARNDTAEKYAEFVRLSPGKHVAVASDEMPAVGHGRDRAFWKHLWLSVRV